ncbi:adenylyl-sulfate kinase [Paenibacillaceae bacterium]|nr:adenylyl-sulfate kinase [Paenibacillaceae bacterium]
MISQLNGAEVRNEAPVLWFTGLSGSGKTTTAARVAADLRKAGHAVEMLDGDELRETICRGLGFSREDRMENIKRIAYVANLLARNGVIVLVTAISPYREMRSYLRSELPGYVEVYVNCPLEECERRDVKGLYAKARRGEIGHFTGISDPYDIPERPHITVRTDVISLAENCHLITEWLYQSGKMNNLHAIVPEVSKASKVSEAPETSEGSTPAATPAFWLGEHI